MASRHVALSLSGYVFFGSSLALSSRVEEVGVAVKLCIEASIVILCGAECMTASQGVFFGFSLALSSRWKRWVWHWDTLDYAYFVWCC